MKKKKLWAVLTAVLLLCAGCGAPAELVDTELPENEAERALRLAAALSGGLLDTQEGDFRVRGTVNE